MLSPRVTKAYREVREVTPVLSSKVLELVGALEEQFPELLPPSTPKFRKQQMVVVQHDRGEYYRKVKLRAWGSVERTWKYDVGYGSSDSWKSESELRAVVWSDVVGEIADEGEER